MRLIKIPKTELVIERAGSDDGFLLDSPIDEFQHVQLTGASGEQQQYLLR